MDAEPWTHDFAVTDELWNDLIDVVYGNGETDAGRGARRAQDGGIYADEPPGTVQKRPAGVTRVDGSVRLDDAFDLPAGFRSRSRDPAR